MSRMGYLLMNLSVPPTAVKMSVRSSIEVTWLDSEISPLLEMFTVAERSLPLFTLTGVTN